MELSPDGSFRCLEFSGLEHLIGPPPVGMSPEAAYDAAVHPDDRERYDAATGQLSAGEAVELEYRLRGYDGRVRWVLDRMRPTQIDGGRTLVDGVVADITGRKRAEAGLRRAHKVEAQRLAHAALHDALTGLANRVAFEEHLQLALARARRNGHGVAVLFIDIDNLKLVNDSFGHRAGDEVLRAVAARLARAARASDVVARQGGDEFLILLADLAPEAGSPLRLADAAGPAEIAASRVGRALRDPFVVNGIETFVTASVGISLFPFDSEDGDLLTKQADLAMYTVKGAGRDGYRRYASRDDEPVADLSLAGRLRRAINEDRGLVLRYQPIVRLQDGTVVGAEALIRLDHEDRGLLLPREFLGLAERVGLIGRMSDWVVEMACRQAAAWQAQGLDLYVSVNLPLGYCDLAGMRRLQRTLDELDVKPGGLVIEVTEAAGSVNSWNEFDAALDEVRRRSVRIAIDDFGTGHSSLVRLNRSWVSMLKIDQSFVGDMGGGSGGGSAARDSSALVAGVIALARSLGLEPIAEGIETERQRKALLDMGCDLGQGFLFSEAVPAAEVAAMCPSSRTGVAPRGNERPRPSRPVSLAALRVEP